MAPPNLLTPTLFFAYVLIIFCRCFLCIVGMAFIWASIEVWYMWGMRYTLLYPPPNQKWCGAAIATSPSPHHKTWTYYGVENLQLGDIKPPMMIGRREAIKKNLLMQCKCTMGPKYCALFTTKAEYVSAVGASNAWMFKILS